MTKTTTETNTVETVRTAEQWWAWHDRDDSRWSASPEEGEARCANWVSGTSDDGPTA